MGPRWAFTTATITATIRKGFVHSTSECKRALAWSSPTSSSLPSSLSRARTDSRGENLDRGVGPFTEAIELQSDKVLDGEVWRLATYAFAHDSVRITPIIFNILFVIWIGRQIEDIYGWKEFLSFYLLVGLMAGVAFLGACAASQQDGILMGARGSITAVLVLYALHFPRRMVCGYVPFWFIAIVYVMNDSLGFMAGYRNPAAFACHAVAGVFALLYHHYSLRVSTWLPGVPSRASTRRRPQTKLQIFREPAGEEAAPAPASAPSSHPKPTTATAPVSGTATQAEMDEQLEAKLDEVLQKMKKHGRESLTEEEQAVLFRASEIYKKRRKMGE